MELAHLGLIGAGSIATELVALLAGALPRKLARVTVLTRPGREAEIEAALGPALHLVADKAAYVRDAAALRAAHPDLVVEAAGHGAVSAHVETLLAAGIETIVASTGALADPDLEDRLSAAAAKGKTRMVIPSGAVGGMDALAALQSAGLQSVTYTGRKPPLAWSGTPAAEAVDLEALREAEVIFEGSARQAARDYPKNANVAATVALCGAGFENTSVRLIADPAVSENTHEVEAVASAGRLRVQVAGYPAPLNPKTSLLTVHSLAREILRRTRPLAV